MPFRASKRSKQQSVSSSQAGNETGCPPLSLRKNARKLRLLSRDAPCFIAKLPDEIILEMFYFCLATLNVYLDLSGEHSASATYHDLTDLGTSPLNISQVSVRWRRIARSSTSLWSVVVLRTGLLQQRHFVALNLWLSRSQSKATPITISLSICDANQPNPVALSFFRRYIAHNKRLKVLHVHLHHKISTNFDIDIFNGPSLEEFVFTTTHPTYVPFELTRSPRLKNLKLFGQLRYSARSLDGLQSLDLDLRDMPGDFFGLLGKLPSLETLMVKFTYWLLPEPSSTSLTRLRSLSLRSGRTAESSFVFLDNLLGVAPSLSSLELSSPWTYSPLRWRQLLVTIETHSPPLVHFSLRIDSRNNDRLETDAPEVGVGFLATLLRSTPNLKSLSSNYGTSENFVRAMTLQSAMDLNICPKLEEVHFGRFSSAVTAHCLVNMIVSRINTGEKALKKVKLTPFHYHDISRRKVIKMSMSRGLQLSSSISK